MRRIAVFSSVLLCWVAVVAADQNDTRLNRLFLQLKTGTQPEQLQQIEAQIWQIWVDSGRTDVNTLMDEGIRAMQRGDYDSALMKFDRIIELVPRFAEGWNKRATVYYLRDELRQSMRDVQRTLALEPRHFGALSGMGLIFMQSGDTAAAVQAFEEVLKLYPNSPGARANLERLRTELRDGVI